MENSHLERCSTVKIKLDYPYICRYTNAMRNQRQISETLSEIIYHARRYAMLYDEAHNPSLHKEYYLCTRLAMMMLRGKIEMASAIYRTELGGR